MAKTKKTVLNENKKLKTKQCHNNKIIKNNNLNCVVKLDRIDHLLHKYKINNDSNAHHKEINIGIRIKNDKLTIRDQSISIEQHNDEFNFELCLKNDDVHLVALQKVRDESVIKSPRPKSSAFLQLQLDKKPARQPGKLPRSKTVAELANDSWKRCKSHNKSKQLNLKVGQYVMSKMKSYSPWPSRLTGFTKNRKKAYVYFYGTHNTGSVEVGDITLFEDSEEVIRMHLIRNLDLFAKGVKEIEMEIGIPDELSITNRRVIH